MQRRTQCWSGLLAFGEAGLYIGGGFLTANGQASDGIGLWTSTKGLTP